MRRFNEIIFGEKAQKCNTVVCCKSKEQIREFIDYMNFRWGTNYNWSIVWNDDYTKSRGVNFNGACLYVDHSGWDTIEYCRRNNCTILPFELVAQDYFPVLEGKELKVGDIVWHKKRNLMVEITKINHDQICHHTGVIMQLDNNSVFDNLETVLSWKKPEIKYTLPNREGVQEEVVVGQRLYRKGSKNERVVCRLWGDKIYYTRNGKDSLGYYIKKQNR